MLAIVLTGFGYIVLLGWLILRKNKQPPENWALGYCVWSLSVAGSQLLVLRPDLIVVPGYQPTFLLQASIYLVSAGLLGTLTAFYLNLQREWVWAAVGGGLAAIILLLVQLNAIPNLTTDLWRDTIIQRGGPLPVTLLITWGGTLIVLHFITLIELYNAQLPLHANRLLWWLLVLLIISSGELIMIWGSEPLSSIGLGLRWLGVLAAVYSVSGPRLLDIRNFARASLGTTIMVMIIAVVVLVGIGGALYFLAVLPDSQAVVAVVITVLVLAATYQALHSRIERLVAETILRSGYDTAQVVAQLSQRTANLLEINQLTEAVAELLREAIEVQRVRLILFTPNSATHLNAQVYVSAGQPTPEPHDLLADSPFLNALSSSHQPVLQYSLDIDPKFKAMPPAELEWLQALRVAAYLPLHDGKTLSGLLAIGPRSTGDPYRERELALFMALANQTAVALKNVRLFSQQSELNAQMLILNDNLLASNERMAQIDSVKSDFITIASHELRTPLTQIRGYIDIIAVMNSNNMLKTGQIADITASILKACERLNDVIGKMLEVSQIDVETLALDFTEISIEQLLRQSIGPLMPAIQNRALNLTVHHVRGLPTLIADESRITQALSQVIGNAIKFTPDGGQIEISGRHRPDEQNRPETVEITIRDTGIGIDPRHHELIFEKFFRVGHTNLHSTSDTKFMGAGPGLGLTIAKGIIAAHGGNIWAESVGHDPENYPGSAFYISLPLTPATIPPTAMELEPETVLSAAFIELSPGEEENTE